VKNNAAQHTYDCVVIRGGNIADGSIGPLKEVDVVVTDGKVTALEPRGAVPDSFGYTVNAHGLVVSPGFIDTHSHADNAPLLASDDCSKIQQGVTTEVVGNCGKSLAPVGLGHEAELGELLERLFPKMELGWHSWPELLAVLDSRGYVTNYVPLIGHGTLRLSVLGMEDRAPDPEEFKRMVAGLEAALEAGVFGFSTGLVYAPGMFSATQELCDLASVLPERGIYATHIRGEGRNLLASIREAIRVGQSGRGRVQISHLKAMGKNNWGLVQPALQELNAARERGLQIHQDVYPYTAGSTMLAACFPPWFHVGGGEAMLRRLNDSAALGRAREEIEGDGTGAWESHVAAAGYDGIRIATTATHRCEGETLGEIGRRDKVSPFEAMVTILKSEKLRVSMVVFAMCEEDIEQVLRDPATTVGSDGLPPGTGGNPHPRLFGTFPRVLGEYVRTRRVLGLTEAVAMMTSRPADAFGLRHIGRIAPGYAADLVAFDPGEIGHRGDYTTPSIPPDGIAWVMQAGSLTVEKGQWLGVRQGRRLQPS